MNNEKGIEENQKETSDRVSESLPYFSTLLG